MLESPSLCLCHSLAIPMPVSISKTKGNTKKGPEDICRHIGKAWEELTKVMPSSDFGGKI